MTAFQIGLAVLAFAVSGEAGAQSAGPAKMIVLGSEGGVAITQFPSMAACRRAEGFIERARDAQFKQQQDDAARNGGVVAKYRPAPVTYCVPEQ